MPMSHKWGMVVYAMVVCKLNDIEWSMFHVVIKSRPTGKIQTHWERESVHELINTK